MNKTTFEQCVRSVKVKGFKGDLKTATDKETGIMYGIVWYRIVLIWIDTAVMIPSAGSS